MYISNLLKVWKVFEGSYDARNTMIMMIQNKNIFVLMKGTMQLQKVLIVTMWMTHVRFIATMLTTPKWCQ